MKKVLIALCFMLGLTGIAAAQTQKKAPAATQIQKKVPAATAAPGTATGFKRDGTPGKRFKANKLKKQTDFTPLKKDGTPAMRNKKNQVKKG